MLQLRKGIEGRLMSPQGHTPNDLTSPPEAPPPEGSVAS